MHGYLRAGRVYRSQYFGPRCALIETQQLFATLNAFIEDTCVLATVAYLLARSRPVASLLRPFSIRKAVMIERPELAIRLGLILGLFATSEVIFPGARAPYESDSLIVCLAMFLGGWQAALPAAGVVCATAVILRSPAAALQTCLLLSIVIVVSFVGRRFDPKPPRPLSIGLTGGFGQGVASAVSAATLPLLGMPPSSQFWIVSSLANALGLVIVASVLQDAETRARSEEHRLEAEQSKSLLVSADLAALRAKIRPHFIFNTLTAISALCSIDPAKAEFSILRLARLLRRSLEIDAAALVRLDSELDYVRAYVDIQTVRFGSKVEFVFDIDDRLLKSNVPPFGIQTLVENCYQHAFVRAGQQGRIVVRVSKHRSFATICVGDNGVGMDQRAMKDVIDAPDPPRRGLAIVDRHLRLHFGAASRLRLFSALGAGTIAAFKIPHKVGRTPQ